MVDIAKARRKFLLENFGVESLNRQRDADIELFREAFAKVIGPTRAEWYAEACKMECDANSEVLLWACRYREIVRELVMEICERNRHDVQEANGLEGVRCTGAQGRQSPKGES